MQLAIHQWTAENFIRPRICRAEGLNHTWAPMAYGPCVYKSSSPIKGRARNRNAHKKKQKGDKNEPKRRHFDNFGSLLSRF